MLLSSKHIDEGRASRAERPNGISSIHSPMYSVVQSLSLSLSPSYFNASCYCQRPVTLM